MTIESQCAAALKRLERSLAISVGMHKAASRKRFAEARLRLLPQIEIVRVTQGALYRAGEAPVTERWPNAA